MNLTLLRGVQINPIDRQVQNMLAMKNMGRYDGIALMRLNDSGSMNEMRVMIVVVFFSTTTTRFSYHANLSVSASAS